MNKYTNKPRWRTEGNRKSLLCVASETEETSALGATRLHFYISTWLYGSESEAMLLHSSHLLITQCRSWCDINANLCDPRSCNTVYIRCFSTANYVPKVSLDVWIFFILVKSSEEHDNQRSIHWTIGLYSCCTDVSSPAAAAGRDLRPQWDQRPFIVFFVSVCTEGHG